MRRLVGGEMEGNILEFGRNGGEVSLVYLVLSMDGAKFLGDGFEGGLNVGLLGFQAVIDFTMCVRGHGRRGMKAPNDKD